MYNVFVGSRQCGGDSISSWTETKFVVPSLDYVSVEIGLAVTSVTIFGDFDGKCEVVTRFIGPEVQATIVRRRDG